MSEVDKVDISKLHILVVEDENYTRGGMIRMLEGIGTGQISSAPDGHEALTILQKAERRVDVILLDLQMPRVNGYEFIKKLRNEFEPPLSDTPVIVISGHSEKKALDRVRGLGVSLFLLKPITADQALTRIHAAMRHKFGNMEMAEYANTDDDRDELVSNAKKAVDRGAPLTQQLLSFSHRQTLSLEVVDLNEIVLNSLRLIERTLGEAIEIVRRFSEEPLPVKIDTAMFGNALLNLSLNAKDAMPDGGQLTIATTPVELDGDIAEEDNEPLTGPYALITISDTGHGIYKDNLDWVVKPFFTTNEVGTGSGLGLSMVYEFLNQSGGHLLINSKQGKGTTISLYVPLTEEKAKAIDDAFDS